MGTAPTIDSRVLFPDLLKELGLTGAGIEVGCAKGRFSDYLLRRWQPKEFYLVDAVLEETTEKLLNEWKALASKTVFLQGYSTDEAKVLSFLPENHFDFIYIDASHKYKIVK